MTANVTRLGAIVVSVAMLAITPTSSFGGVANAGTEYCSNILHALENPECQADDREFVNNTTEGGWNTQGGCVLIATGRFGLDPSIALPSCIARMEALERLQLATLATILDIDAH